MRVLISGASGLIGSSLARELAYRGAGVFRLVRRRPEDAREVALPPQGHPAQFEDFTAVIHLAGANIAAHRWTEAYKREIAESRIQPTAKLAHVLAGLKRPPQVFLCASAIGIYGDRSACVPSGFRHRAPAAHGKPQRSRRAMPESGRHTCASAWCLPRKVARLTKSCPFFSLGQAEDSGAENSG